MFSVAILAFALIFQSPFKPYASASQHIRRGDGVVVVSTMNRCPPCLALKRRVAGMAPAIARTGAVCMALNKDDPADARAARHYNMLVRATRWPQIFAIRWTGNNWHVGRQLSGNATERQILQLIQAAKVAR